MALKSARIVDFCCKSSGYADLENSVDRGSAVNFGADSGLCLSRCLILGHKRNLDHRFFFSLGRYVNQFIQIISFFEKAHLNSGVRLLLELYCVVVIKYVIFLTICAKLLVTVAFTCNFRILSKILVD